MYELLVNVRRWVVIASVWQRGSPLDEQTESVYALIKCWVYQP